MSKKIFANALSAAGKAISKVKNANGTPTAMLVVGVTTIVGAGVYACVQTMKLEDRIDEAKESIDHVKELKEAGEYVVDTETGEKAEYTVALYRRDMAYAWGSGIWSIAKLYLPSIIGTGVGITFIGGSHKIMADRLTQATLAFAALSESYDKYRKNVIKVYGEDVDKKMRLGLETKKNFEMGVIDPETGEVINKKEKNIDVVTDVTNVASEYAIVLNDCSFWLESGYKYEEEEDIPGDRFNYNKYTVDIKLENLRRRLNRDHYIYYYDILNEFGILDRTPIEIIAMSHQTGIMEGYGDGFLGANFVPTHLGSEDYYKRVLLLDFNCIGGDYVNGKYMSFNDMVYNKVWLDKKGETF